MLPFRDWISRKETRIAAAIALGFLLLGLLRINDLSLYTDSTRYLIFGNSLSNLDGYVDDTRPVPSTFVLNAPLYPLLLAPVEVFFPLSVEAAKIWTLLWASGGLALFFLWLRTRFSLWASLAATVLLATNSLFIVTSTEILSEAPFFVSLIAIFWSADIYFSDRKDERARWVLLGTLAMLPLLREIGAAFVLAGLIVLFRKKAGKDFVILLLSAAILTAAWAIRNTLAADAERGEATNTQFLFQHFATSPDSSILTEFGTRIWLYLQGYGLNVGGSIFFPFPESLIVDPGPLYDWLSPVLQTFSIPILIVALLLAVPGARFDLSSGSSGLLRLIGSGCMFAIIILYPVFDVRFLAPFLPVLLFYTLLTLQQAAARIINPMIKHAVAFALSLLVIAPNLVADFELLRTNLQYRAGRAKPLRSINEAVHFGQPWGQMGEWIRTNLPDSIVIASPAKELVPFIANRKLLETSRTLPTPIIERFLRDHEARYLLTTSLWEDLEAFDLMMAESRRYWFKLVHSAGYLKLYEIHSTITDPPAVPKTPMSDTTSIQGLLILGRRKLQELQYESAAGLLNMAVQRAPFRPEPTYELMAAVSIAGDTAAALQLFERLFTLPQSTSYTQLARAMIVTMGKLQTAQRQSSFQRSFTAFDGGLAYWQLGYTGPALAVMRNIAKADSLNFVSALWGTHFARQLGDTAESNEFLKRLNKIDKNAAIVADWNSLRRFEERIKASRGVLDKAKLHMQVAQIYSKIELYEEALDALERAEAASSDVIIDITLARADIFEKKKTVIAATRAYKRILDLEPHNRFAKERLDSLAM